MKIGYKFDKLFKKSLVVSEKGKDNKKISN